MAKELKIFRSEKFGAIRTMVDNETGRVLFCGKDVAEVLGYKNPNEALREHCKGVSEILTPTAGGRQNMKYITEADVYRLVMRSKLPEAEQFQDWVCEEVLPRIRKTGGYIPVREEESAETILSKALLIMERTVKLQREELEQKSEALGQLAPLAEYADAVLLSPTCYTMTEVAKSLSMTVHELQHLLHSWGVIYRSPSGIWMLYADYLQQGYEAYRTRKGENVHGDVLWTSSYLVWTERGKHFIHRLVGERLAA